MKLYLINYLSSNFNTLDLRTTINAYTTKVVMKRKNLNIVLLFRCRFILLQYCPSSEIMK